MRRILIKPRSKTEEIGKEAIESEAEMVFKLIKFLIFLPATLILVLFRIREPQELLVPFVEIGHFLLQPKFTVFVVLLNIIIFFFFQQTLVSLGIVSEGTIEALMNHPSDLFSFNFLPILTSLFLHANIAHLFGNMLVLYILGRVVERELGFIKTVIIYFGGGILSNILWSMVMTYVFHADVSALGASGAISGLAAAAMLLNPFYITFILGGIPLPIFVIVLLSMFLDLSNISQLGDNFGGSIAHLIGYLSVGIILFAMSGRERHEMANGLMWVVISVIVAVGVWFFVFGGRVEEAIDKAKSFFVRG